MYHTEVFRFAHLISERLATDQRRELCVCYNAESPLSLSLSLSLPLSFSHSLGTLHSSRIHRLARHLPTWCIPQSSGIAHMQSSSLNSFPRKFPANRKTQFFRVASMRSGVKKKHFHGSKTLHFQNY